MSQARVVLHAAAFIAPVVAVYGVIAAFGLHVPEVGGMVVPAIAAAQIGALTGWPLLERFRASAWGVPLMIGLLMALVTHLVFGPLSVVSQMPFSKTSMGDDAFSAALLFSCLSAVVAGPVSAPATMAIAVFVHRLRSKELVRVTV